MKEKRIIIFGYGSQGHAQALNLRDSGYNVTVCLRPESPRIASVQENHLPLVTNPVEAAKNADIVALLIPDSAQKGLYNEIKDYLPAHSSLLFASGFALHYGLVQPRRDLDVLLAAPKLSGEGLRSAYVEKTAVPLLIAVHQDVTGTAWSLVQSYALALGSVQPSETTFREEAETDLFSEQVLIGGLAELLSASFDALVKAGFSPQVAHEQCFKKTKAVAGMFAEYGIQGALQKMSETARRGALTCGPRVIDTRVKETIQKILGDVPQFVTFRNY